MRLDRLLPCLAIFLPFCSSISAQTPTPDATIAARAKKAFSAGKPITSVEMTGTAQWIAGSINDSGPLKLNADVNGENRAEFDLANGTRIETQSAIGDDRVCTWSGKDGVVHDVTMPNCWVATIWFLPHLALQGAGSPPTLQIQREGVEEQRGKSSSHIHHEITLVSEITSLKPAAAEIFKKIQLWSQTDLEVDPATSLPASLKYTIHPDDNSAIDIPIEVRYSKYQSVSGVELPMHIERYVNGSLQLSIDIDSAVIN